MNTVQKQRNWTQVLSAFNAENAGRPTRLGVFESAGDAVNDYWLENGLPLQGVTFEERNGRLSAEILLDGFTHVVENADRVELIFGSSGLDDGINVVDAAGRTSVLRFEENL
jgi:hypothetical protein